MPVRFEWNNDQKSIATITVSERWTWADYEAAYHEFTEAAKSLHHSIFLITDAQNTRHLPPNALMGGAQVMRRLPNNVETHFLVGANTLIRQLADLFLKMYKTFGDKVEILKTKEEALQYIEQRITTGKL